jgi:hypothetical protein
LAASQENSFKCDFTVDQQAVWKQVGLKKQSTLTVGKSFRAIMVLVGDWFLTTGLQNFSNCYGTVIASL